MHSKKKWESDILNYEFFQDYVRDLCRIELINEYRIYHLANKPLDMSISDWPNIFVCALTSSDSFIRKECVKLISRIDHKISIPALSYLSYHFSEIEDRSLCLICIGLTEDKNVISFLSKFYEYEQSIRLREDCCYALGLTKSDLAVFPLLSFSLDSKENESVKLMAIWSIYKIGGGIAEKALFEISKNENSSDEIIDTTRSYLSYLNPLEYSDFIIGCDETTFKIYKNILDDKSSQK